MFQDCFLGLEEVLAIVSQTAPHHKYEENSLVLMLNVTCLSPGMSKKKKYVWASLFLVWLSEY